MSGLTVFPLAPPVKDAVTIPSARKGDSNNAFYNTPLILRELYGVPKDAIVTHPQATQGVQGGIFLLKCRDRCINA